MPRGHLASGTYGLGQVKAGQTWLLLLPKRSSTLRSSGMLGGGLSDAWVRAQSVARRRKKRKWNRGGDVMMLSILGLRKFRWCMPTQGQQLRR